MDGGRAIKMRKSKSSNHPLMYLWGFIKKTFLQIDATRLSIQFTIHTCEFITSTTRISLISVKLRYIDIWKTWSWALKQIICDCNCRSNTPTCSKVKRKSIVCAPYFYFMERTEVRLAVPSSGKYLELKEDTLKRRVMWCKLRVNFFCISFFWAMNEDQALLPCSHPSEQRHSPKQTSHTQTDGQAFQHRQKVSSNNPEIKQKHTVRSNWHNLKILQEEQNSNKKQVTLPSCYTTLWPHPHLFQQTKHEC